MGSFFLKGSFRFSFFSFFFIGIFPLGSFVNHVTKKKRGVLLSFHCHHHHQSGPLTVNCPWCGSDAGALTGEDVSVLRGQKCWKHVCMPCLEGRNALDSFSDLADMLAWKHVMLFPMYCSLSSETQWQFWGTSTTRQVNKGLQPGQIED